MIAAQADDKEVEACELRERLETRAVLGREEIQGDAACVVNKEISGLQVSVVGVCPRELMRDQIVQRLVDLKILAEITGQARHRRFRYDAYVRLFDEEAGT